MGYFAIALSILGAYYFLSSVRAWYRLRHFKGPFLASFSYLWLARTTLSGRAYKIHHENSQKYGEPFVRIGPDLLITDNAEMIRRINAARSPYRRDSWYDAFRTNPYSRTIISCRDEEYHSFLKTRTLPGYSGKEIPSLESDLGDQMANFKRYIRSKYLSTDKKTRLVDLAVALHYYVVDVITKIGIGQEWGCLASDSDVDSFIREFNQASPFIMLCCDVPWARKVFANNFMLRLLGPNVTDKTGVGKMMGVTKKIVDHRFQPDVEQQNDMLGSFMRHGLNKVQCDAELPVVVLAGSDTSASVIKATMLYIMTTPRVYSRLQTEIDGAIKGGTVSSPITQAEAKQLPYLQAVIYEGIRIQPPSQIFLTKRAPPEGDTVLGYRIPGGTGIAWNLWSLLQDKNMFGEDAYLFRPERWLQIDADKKQEMERHVELIFGYGRYLCSGKHVAMLHLQKVYFELLRDFDFQLVYPKSAWTERQYNGFIIKDMWVRITERQLEAT
ncbi:cytochrome P450 [Podospora aff. communis PSN243]|uniref:Cytochrome P450 n=1 Tax=Podospora aff. communis PSN243 TaxID=3040156 RepID=A0AAV9GUI0_9PEZI|nr:cytochrome P450 [Podospora aff. communis PSN243]